MKHFIWNRELSEQALGTLKYVLSIGGTCELKNVENDMLDALMHSIFEQKFDLDKIKLISPVELASANIDAEHKQRILEFLVIMPYVDGETEPKKVALVHEFADHLKVHPDSFKLLKDMSKKWLLMGQFCLTRKVMPAMFKGSLSEKARVFWQMYEEVKGDPKTLARYEALKDYPARSLGKAFYDFYQKHQFPLPGAKHCFPSALLTVHDCSHILSGFEPDYAGEISVGAFQAGYIKEYAWSLAVVGLVDFNCGLALDLPPHLKANKGQLIPGEFARALRMGMDMNLDLYDNWDYWSAFKMPVSELRAKYNIKGAKDII